MQVAANGAKHTDGAEDADERRVVELRMLLEQQEPRLRGSEAHSAFRDAVKPYGYVFGDVVHVERSTCEFALQKNEGRPEGVNGTHGGWPPFTWAVPFVYSPHKRHGYAGLRYVRASVGAGKRQRRKAGRKGTKSKAAPDAGAQAMRGVV